jgi:mono/diheme cytochrome c family protein
MGTDDPQPSTPDAKPQKSEQEIFEAEVARFSGRAVIFFGGLAILAALVMSTVALLQSSDNGGTTTTVTAPAGAATQAAAPLTGDALGRQLFVAGDAATGVTACAGCHTMQTAGATATVGPNLDKELGPDPASATRESIVDPNKEIIPGYQANVMPVNYGTALTPVQLDALVNYVYHSTNTKAKAKAKAAKASG